MCMSAKEEKEPSLKVFCGQFLGITQLCVLISSHVIDTVLVYILKHFLVLRIIFCELHSSQRKRNFPRLRLSEKPLLICICRCNFCLNLNVSMPLKYRSQQFYPRMRTQQQEICIFVQCRARRKKIDYSGSDVCLCSCSTLVEQGTKT